MGNVNKLFSALKPSATLALKAKTQELVRQGRSIIDLSCGEPDIDTPQFIKDAAIRAMADGKTKYEAVPGIPKLREAISEKFKRDNGIDTTPDRVIITNGGKQALHEAFTVALEPGDEVIIPSPYWVSYPPMVELALGVPKIVPTRAENGYRLQPDELQSAITPRTKMVVLNGPSNPTGAAYTKEQYAALGEVILKSNALVISDEVYEKLLFDNFPFISFAQACPELASRTITVNAMSKAYSMTGWRVGYATGPLDLIKAMGNFQSQTTSNVNSIAQYASLAAFTGPADFLVELNKEYAVRLELALGIIERTPGLCVQVRPNGAFYLFVRLEDLLQRAQGRKFQGSSDVAAYLLEEAGVAGVPGIEFGDDNAIRFSIATSRENIKAALEKTLEALSKIKLE